MAYGGIIEENKRKTTGFIGVVLVPRLPAYRRQALGMTSIVHGSRYDMLGVRVSR